MPFPVRANMTSEEFRTEIIDHYFPHFRDAGGERRSAMLAIRDDYASIGAFLTHKDDVKGALRGLESDIRDHLVTTAPPDTRTRLENFRRGDAAFKTHKVLSAALGKREIEEGFNNPNDYGKLHTTATMASGTDRFDMQAAGRPVLRSHVGPTGPEHAAVAMPKSVPTVVGFGLDGKDFNRILLAHGYQFKDVAAGRDHGEYTHRLQWYAIYRALAFGDLTLTNRPIDIFRSMGAVPDSAANANVRARRHLYLWEALFDNFKSDEVARNNNTEAYCTDTFNSPEVLNMELVRTANQAATPFNDKDSGNLFCLCVLLKLRYDKRGRQEGEGRDYAAKLYTDKPKTVTAGGIAPGGYARDNPLASALFWYTN